MNNQLLIYYTKPKSYCIKLILYIVITTIIALSVHIISLYIGIPYPNYKILHNQIIEILAMLSKVIGYYIFYYLAYFKLFKLNKFKQLILLFLLILAIQESLIRLQVMEMLVTKTFWFPIVTSIPNYLNNFVLASWIVIFFSIYYQSLTNVSKLSKLLYALLSIILAMVIYILAAKFGNWLIGNIIPYINQPLAQNNYDFPYPLWVNIIAYITYLVPVIASFSMFSLIIKTNKSIYLQGLIYIIIILLIRSYFVIVTAVLFSADKPLTALMSVGQFVLELITLGILTIVFIKALLK
ncbi:hypothetical protein ACFX5K_05685 [Rickettsiales bacterium LUAb2]